VCEREDERERDRERGCAGSGGDNSTIIGVLSNKFDSMCAWESVCARGRERERGCE